MHKSILSRFIHQIKDIGVGVRIAASMMTASLRSGYTICMLFCMTAVLILYYLDVVMRALFSGGSFLSWSLINTLKRRGYIFDTTTVHAQWLLHLPEHFLLISVVTLFALIFLHIVKRIIEREPYGIGRAVCAALASWRFIVCYSLCASIVLWCVGDINLMAVRAVLEKIYDSSFLVSFMHAPFFGKQVLQLPLSITYWLSSGVRWMLAILWTLSTFLLFSVEINERVSFFKAIWRATFLAMRNFGLIVGALFFYVIMHAGIMAGTLYLQAATLPSLEHLGMKGAQVVGIFALMTVLLFAIHGAVLLCGQLITGLLIYQASVGTTMEDMHLFVIRKSCRSLIWYHLFYVTLFLIVRLSVQILIPTV